VMEQCVNRLDVAMFNAILRKSVDDIPTDPISNPIRDSKVLPIPAGNSSVGLGAQLKNVERKTLTVSHLRHYLNSELIT
ncbi:nucleolar-like protein, partial [Thalictrum thalictroides]